MKSLVFPVALILILCSSPVQQSRAQNSDCNQRLLPCMNYMNGTRDPPRSCCDPLKYVIKYEPECLCRMISVRGANQAEQAGINLTNAQQLPGKCGEHIDPLGCILGKPIHTYIHIFIYTHINLYIYIYIFFRFTKFTFS